MITLENSIASSMDCTDPGLIPFLPYILQDFLEIGSSPDTILGLIRRHQKRTDTMEILDLGCGKGAVSLKLASELDCRCHGIDGIEDFIRHARTAAGNSGVGSRCTFETGDIRLKIRELPPLKYGVIILSAIGPVFGDYYETSVSVREHLRDDGILIVDDGFTVNEGQTADPRVYGKKDILAQTGRAGMEMIDEKIMGPEEKGQYDEEYEDIVRRCRELIRQHPDKKELFESYIRKQKDEYDLLRGKIVSSTMVFRKRK